MATAFMATEPAIVSIATRHILGFLVASLLCLLQLTSARGSNAGVADMAAYSGKAFIASFRSHPVYGDPSVSVQLSSSASSTFNRLHSWFTFNTTTRSISGVPLPEDVGWTSLTVRTECDHVSNLEDKNAYPCNESSDEFKLIVHTLLWSDFLAARIKSTESSIEPSVEISSIRSGGIGEPTAGEHGCGEDSVIASLVLCVSINDLNANDRFDLVVKLSDFLSIPISSIIVESSSSYTLSAITNGFQMVSAGPGSGEICNLIQNVELLWQLPCSTVKHLTDFIRVLQHNVDGGRLADEISTGIVGWYVASSNPQSTKHNRRRRQAGQHTVVPTPVLQPLRPTTVVVRGDDGISSSVMSSLIHSMHLIPERHEDSLIHASPSALLSLTTVVISTSAQPLLSLSLTTHDVSLPVLRSSTSALDISSEIQPTVMQESVSLTSHSTTSIPHLFVGSAFMTEVPSELPDQSTHLYSSIVLSDSPLSVVTTALRPEFTTVVVFESSGVLEEFLTSASQEIFTSTSQEIFTSTSQETLTSTSQEIFTSTSQEILTSTSQETFTSTSQEIFTSTSQEIFTSTSQKILTSTSQEDISDGLGLITSTLKLLPESAPGLPADVFSSWKPPPVSRLLLDSHLLVTSRTVEVWTFPFTSVHTESSIPAILSSDVGFHVSIEPSSGPYFTTSTTSSADIEFSGEAKSSLEFSIDVMFSHYVSDEMASSKPEGVYEYTATFEYNATSRLQGTIATTQDTDRASLLITQSPSELVASTLLMTSDLVAVDSSATVTPSHLLSWNVTSVFDGIQITDTDLMTDQIPTASVTEGDISPVEDAYTTGILHIYPETDLHLTETTLNTSSYDAGLSVWSSGTLIIPSAVMSASTESRLSELMESPSALIATSFTSATTQLVEAQPSAWLSPDLTEAVVEETVSWTPSITTEWGSAAWPTDDAIEETNKRPYVGRPIDHIDVQLGRQLRFVIPQDLFLDQEDGNTSSLTLSLMSESNQELPSNFWLYLERGDQLLLTGLPLKQDMDTNNASILLVATDKEGLSVTHPITIQIVSATSSFTHVFIMKFALNYAQFMQNRRNLSELLSQIGDYFFDNESQFMTVIDVIPGSLVLSWTNNTLTGPVCQMDVIKDLLDKMVRRDGTVRPSFYRQVGHRTNLTEILFEPQGSCYVLPTTTIATTTYIVSDTSRVHGLSVWAHVILPVMIAILVFVLIILIIVFCNRRRRHRQAVLNVEKEAVSNDRNPIFFPDELEVDDPSLKAREPVILPTDPHPNSQSTPEDLSPSKISGDEERTSNQDPVEPEWVPKETTEAVQVQERHPEPKRRKGSKKQKEQSKDSGVSASSTLTWDRPNNHYLEEEAGSRSSTLNSTKSLGSEKRHPKSPPPYWQSQSDPPPYRLPPPYLTETTSQV